MIMWLQNFFGSPFFSIVGGISTILMILGFSYTAYLVIRGVLPVWYRLGIGLSKSKIAIFSLNEFNCLRDMLIDSKIFKEKNIIQVNKNDLRKACKLQILLVHWKDFQNEMHDILSLKKDNQALIIYAPQEEGKIEDVDILKEINQQRNSVIVNFRGRLMNDIITGLITVSYDKQ
ncbi:MAG: hypothetical protein KIT27_11620 [Legionellales bacterium]|nr:hypothetical protein [Legionellales bacterium]